MQNILFYFILFYFILFYFIKYIKQPKKKMLIFYGFGFAFFLNEMVKFLRGVKIWPGWKGFGRFFDLKKSYFINKKSLQME